MRQVYVCPGLASRVPTICMLLSTPFQEHVSNFAINMLLLQNATIMEKNVRVSILESTWIASNFSTSSIIALHVLATKFCTKESVPIGTPIPTKPSGQKEARDTSPLRFLIPALRLPWGHALAQPKPEAPRSTYPWCIRRRREKAEGSTCLDSSATPFKIETGMLCVKIDLCLKIDFSGKKKKRSHFRERKQFRISWCCSHISAEQSQTSTGWAKHVP